MLGHDFFYDCRMLVDAAVGGTGGVLMAVNAQAAALDEADETEESNQDDTE